MRSRVREFAAGLPVNIIAMQTLYYTIIGVFGSYLVLYYGSIGFSATQVGVITSAGTLAVLLTQPLLGWASDRAKDGRTIISVLYCVCGALVFAYYLSEEFRFVLIIAVVFAIFHNPIIPIMDSLTFETLEREKSGYNYGHMRVGGTLGYSFMVLLAGRILDNSYKHMFYICSVLLFVSLIFARRASSVKLRFERAPLSPRALLRNKKVLCYMFINLIYEFGAMGFFTFYPLYFTARIGGSGMLGVLLFTTSMSELPFWFIAGKITRRYGYERMLLIAISVVGLRWVLLYFITNMPLLILVNTLHGFCFVTIYYCIINYINDEVPKELRATGQSMNNLSAMVISRVVGGVIFGAMSDAFSMERMFLFIAALSFAGAAVFAVWTRSMNRGRGRERGVAPVEK
jgi:PPP family 3-phenylpropionic acid transporter